MEQEWGIGVELSHLLSCSPGPGLNQNIRDALANMIIVLV